MRAWFVTLNSIIRLNYRVWNLIEFITCNIEVSLLNVPLYSWKESCRLIDLPVVQTVSDFTSQINNITSGLDVTSHLQMPILDSCCLHNNNTMQHAPFINGLLDDLTFPKGPFFQTNFVLFISYCLTFLQLRKKEDIAVFCWKQDKAY